MNEKVNSPAHYGGAQNPYEAIKVIRAWGLGFAIGNALKYLCRAGKKPGESALDDLRKARWYLDNEIAALEGETKRASACRPGERRLRRAPPPWGVQDVVPVQIGASWFEFVHMTTSNAVSEFEWREVPHGPWLRCAATREEVPDPTPLALVRYARAFPERSGVGCEEVGAPA